jgi:hypothetical protein
MGIPTRFISVIILFDRAFEYDHGGGFQPSEVDAKLAPVSMGP